MKDLFYTRHEGIWYGRITPSTIHVIIKKPAVAATLGAILGLVLGLIFGWGIWPVQWTNATPEVLRADLQADYLRMAIDSFRVNGDQTLAVQRYQALARMRRRYASSAARTERSGSCAILNYAQVITGCSRARLKRAVPACMRKTNHLPSTIVISVVGVLVSGRSCVWRVLSCCSNVFRLKPRGEASAAMHAAEVTRQTREPISNHWGWLLRSHRP